MTREKAAKICQSIKFILDKEDYSEEVEEALDMAIAALKQLSLPKIIIRQGEQEPCDKRTDKHTETHACDCINRPKGEWVDDDEQQILMKKFIEKGENWKVCNICGAGMRVGAKYDTDEQYRDFFHNYCPYCGARMESDEQ